MPPSPGDTYFLIRRKQWYNELQIYSEQPEKKRKAEVNFQSLYILIPIKFKIFNFKLILNLYFLDIVLQI